MALESFYGGMPGISPVIKATFKFIDTEDPAYKAKLNHQETYTPQLKQFFTTLSKITNPFNIKEIDIPNEDDEYIVWTEKLLKPFTMMECFSLPDYQDVWYGELCLIDAENYLNPHHGELFRRTLRKWENSIRNTKDTLYADYIGTITGPAGGLPNIKFGSINRMRKEASGLAPTKFSDGTDDYIAENPLDVSHWQYSYIDGRPNLNDEVNETFNKLTCDNITIDDDNPVNRKNDYLNIQVLDSSDTDNIALVPGRRRVDQNIDINDGIKNIDGVDYEYFDNIKYTWCNVRRTLTDGTTDDSWIYLGFQIPYTEFNVNDQEENYTYNGVILDHQQKDIENDIDHPFYHKLTFHIPRGARGIGPEQVFIVGKDGYTKPAGNLYKFDAIQYNQTNDTYNLNENKKFSESELNNLPNTYWIAKWRLYNPKTTVVIDAYQYLGSYKDVKNIQLLDNGKIQIQYSDRDSWIDLNTLTWITEVSLNNNRNSNNYGQFIINFNNDNINNSDKYETILPLIKEIKLNKANGQLTAQYTSEPNLEILGHLNDVVQLTVDYRGHLLVYYSAEDHRPNKNINSGGVVNKGSYVQCIDNPNALFGNNQIWVGGIENIEINHTKIDSTGGIWWHDLGSILNQAGLSIIGVYNSPNLVFPDDVELIATLNLIYPDGHIQDEEGVYHTGGLIIVNNLKIDEDDVEGELAGAYFYDYSNETWTYIGPWNGNTGGNNSKSNLNNIYFPVQLIADSENQYEIVNPDEISYTNIPNDTELFEHSEIWFINNEILDNSSNNILLAALWN